MSDTETQTDRPICLFPGCEREAVAPKKTAENGRSGPPPRYCDIEEHNASSTFQELKRLGDDRVAAPQGSADVS